MSTPNIPYPSRLLLRKLYNARDLGGYAAQDGKVTAFGRFLRSDAPTSLHEKDLAYLLAYPVRTVIDLRSPDEFSHLPHALRDIAQIKYLNIPLLGQNLVEGIAQARPGKTGQAIPLADLYVYLLDQAKGLLGEVFLQMAYAQPGAILFHCAHGKDRTGLVAAILLLLAGVSDADIIANYEVSYTYLKPLFATFWHKIDEESKPYFNTDPQNMEITLRHFHANYRSATEYLEQCGLSRQDIEILTGRLLAGSLAKLPGS